MTFSGATNYKGNLISVNGFIRNNEVEKMDYQKVSNRDSICGCISVFILLHGKKPLNTPFY